MDIQLSFKDILRKLKRKLSKRFNGHNQIIGNCLQVHDCDVFLVSFPRSGNTWMRFVLGGLIHNLDVDFDNMEKFFPDIYRNTSDQLESIEDPRFLKSHEPYDMRYPKVIYIVRDPRDVVISYYYWMLKFNRIKGSFEEFLELFFKVDGTAYGRWDEHYKSWVRNADRVQEGLLLIKYEDLVQKPFDNISKILGFINIDRDNSEIETVIDKNNFLRMKKKESSISDQNQLFKNSDNKIPFLRKGEVSQWKYELNEAQQKRFIEEFGETMNQIGYI